MINRPARTLKTEEGLGYTLTHIPTSSKGEMGQKKAGFRVERDPVGEKRVPAEALYGVQTARALENFRVSRLRVHPSLITAHAERCADYARRSVGVAALFNSERGFMVAAELAEKAIDEAKSVYEIVEEEELG
jgi:aspartate ammonia-lyase